MIQAMTLFLAALAAAVVCLADARRPTSRGTRNKLSSDELSDLHATCGQRIDPANDTYKIEGGHDANPGQYPWATHVEVHYKNGWGTACYHTCAGTLISPRHVVTSAFCFVDEPFTNVPRDVRAYVYYGGTHLNNCTKASTNAFVVHRDHVRNHYVMERGAELAIVQLATDASSESATPICMPAAGTLFEPVLEVYSWGPSPVENRDDTLQMAKVSYTRRTYDCDGWYRMPRAVDFNCVALNHTGHVCDNDAGAGLSQPSHVDGRHQLMGIVAMTQSTCGKYVGNNAPIAFYFDIRPHLRWMCRITGVCPRTA